jgi:hypothetical protein
MKKLYALLISTFFVLNAQAQDSIPQYFTGTEVWGSTNYASVQSMMNTYETVYFLNGDTVINNQKYWKMFLQANIIHPPSGKTIDQIKADSVWGFVRQENRTVFYMGYYPPSYRFEYEEGLRIDYEDTLISYDAAVGSTVSNNWIATKEIDFVMEYQQSDTLLTDSAQVRLKLNTDRIDGLFLEGVSNGEGSIFDPVFYLVAETNSSFDCYQSESYNRSFACENNPGLGNKMCYEGCDRTVGISEGNQVSKLIVYPNPVKSNFNLIDYSGRNNYSLLDVSGKIMWRTKTYSGELISIENLEPGLYFIKERSASGQLLQTQKLIKQ